jgi:hypothetical protein
MAVNKGLRRLDPSRPGITMPDTIPGCRTAFRSNAKIVRHHHGTVSAIPPEYCPPSVRNAVRHGPERAISTADTSNGDFAGRLLSFSNRKESDGGASEVLSMSRIFDGPVIMVFDGLPATGSRVL